MVILYSCNPVVLYLADIKTSLLSQRRQFSLNCKKNIALKIAYKIVALITENYPSKLWLKICSGLCDKNIRKG